MTQQKRHLRTMCVQPRPPKNKQNPKPIHALFLHYFSVEYSCLKVFTYYASIRKVLPLFLSFSLPLSSQPVSLTLPGPYSSFQTPSLSCFLGSPLYSSLLLPSIKTLCS